jgi:hypothetical protein
MGMCLDGTGQFSVEVRRESFRLHFDDTEFPHPEFMLNEMDDLISALIEAREYAREKGIATNKG